MNNILLIDGNSLTYRAYYGTANSPQGLLKTSFGQPTNAVITLNRILQKAIHTYKPTHILVAFDFGSKTFRHKEMKEYKSGRSKTPEELLTQIPIVKEMIQLMGIKYFELKLIEADDIIATIAKKYEENIKINIISSDKDLLQLVSKNINVIQPQNGNKKDKIINLNNFNKINGHNPKQVTDFKGLVGDSSDNLPGVKGLGPKGANKLLLKYKTLENIYQNIDLIVGALKEKLIQNKEIAFKCKKIATLKTDVDISYEINDLFFKYKATEKLINFYKKYEFKSLIPPENFKNIKNKEQKKEKQKIIPKFKNLLY
jgi:DNA polymerase-1